MAIANWKGGNPGSDEEWYKFLNLSANSNNSTNLAVDDKTPLNISAIDTIKDITPITPKYDPKFDFSTSMDWLNKRSYELGDGNPPPPEKNGGLFGKGWVTNENLAGFSSLMSGFGSAAKGWAALKTLGMTKQAYADVNARFRENMDAMKTTTNNQINQTNAWLKAQGRTDFHKNV